MNFSDSCLDLLSNWRSQCDLCTVLSCSSVHLSIKWHITSRNYEAFLYAIFYSFLISKYSHLFLCNLKLCLVCNVVLILFSKGGDFIVLQDSLQTAAAHHKVLESQLTDSVAIVEALSNNNLLCNAVTSTAVLVSKTYALNSALYWSIITVHGSGISELKYSQLRHLSFNGI